jgi:DNA replication protein DnaC
MRSEPLTPDPEKSTTPTTEDLISESQLQEMLDRKRAELGIADPSPAKANIEAVVSQSKKETQARLDLIEREQAESMRGHWERQKERDRMAWRDRWWCELVDGRGRRYAECRFANFETVDQRQQAALDKAKAYAANITQRIECGQNVLFVGPRGTGKDHLAMALAHSAIGAFHRVVWRNGMDMFGAFRDAIKREESESKLIEALSVPAVLWISDPMPPTGGLSEFQQSTLFRVIDERYSRYKPTWFTLNAASGEEMEKVLGAATVDRIRHGAVVVGCNWASYRKKAD